MIFIPQYFRVIRSEVVRVKSEAFVESARVIGASSARIMSRHVLRNSVRTLPLIVTLNCSEAILTLAGLGLPRFRHRAVRGRRVGLRPEQGDRGRDVGHLVDLVFPGLAIVLTVLGITLVGESPQRPGETRALRARREPPAEAAVRLADRRPHATTDQEA